MRVPKRVQAIFEDHQLNYEEIFDLNNNSMNKPESVK